MRLRPATLVLTFLLVGEASAQERPAALELPFANLSGAWSGRRWSKALGDCSRVETANVWISLQVADSGVLEASGGLGRGQGRVFPDGRVLIRWQGRSVCTGVERSYETDSKGALGRDKEGLNLTLDMTEVQCPPECVFDVSVRLRPTPTPPAPREVAALRELLRPQDPLPAPCIPADASRHPPTVVTNSEKPDSRTKALVKRVAEAFEPRVPFDAIRAAASAVYRDTAEVGIWALYLGGAAEEVEGTGRAFATKKRGTVFRKDRRLILLWRDAEQPGPCWNALSEHLARLLN